MKKCEFCSKIYDAKELENMDYGDRWQMYSTITHNPEDNTYNLWIECQDDEYYSGEVLEINFCPKCGRKINPKYKTIR